MPRVKTNHHEALSFLITHLVVEHQQVISLDQLTLFQLTTISQQAADQINTTEGAIPHEVIERFAQEFLEDRS